MGPICSVQPGDLAPARDVGVGRGVEHHRREVARGELVRVRVRVRVKVRVRVRVRLGFGEP